MAGTNPLKTEELMWTPKPIYDVGPPSALAVSGFDFMAGSDNVNEAASRNSLLSGFVSFFREAFGTVGAILGGAAELAIGIFQGIYTGILNFTKTLIGWFSSIFRPSGPPDVIPPYFSPIKADLEGEVAPILESIKQDQEKFSELMLESEALGLRADELTKESSRINDSLRATNERLRKLTAQQSKDIEALKKTDNNITNRIKTAEQTSREISLRVSNLDSSSGALMGMVMGLESQMGGFDLGLENLKDASSRIGESIWQMEDFRQGMTGELKEFADGDMVAKLNELVGAHNEQYTFNRFISDTFAMQDEYNQLNDAMWELQRAYNKDNTFLWKAQAAFNDRNSALWQLQEAYNNENGFLWRLQRDYNTQNGILWEIQRNWNSQVEEWQNTQEELSDLNIEFQQTTIDRDDRQDEALEKISSIQSQLLDIQALQAEYIPRRFVIPPVTSGTVNSINDHFKITKSSSSSVLTVTALAGWSGTASIRMHEVNSNGQGRSKEFGFSVPTASGSRVVKFNTENDSSLKYAAIDYFISRGIPVRKRKYMAQYILPRTGDYETYWDFVAEADAVHQVIFNTTWRNPNYYQTYGVRVMLKKAGETEFSVLSSVQRDKITPRFFTGTAPRAMNLPELSARLSAGDQLRFQHCHMGTDLESRRRVEPVEAIVAYTIPPELGLVEPE